MKKKIIFIVGPTATGKTAIAAVLAKKIHGEIISCDSMQVYKKMELITSAPGPSLKKTIPHHLVAAIEPTKEYNVFRFRRDALKKIAEVLKKGKIPIFVGGTGLYMAILLDGIFKSKAPDKNIRKELYRQAKEQGGEFLYEKLKAVDPQAAGKIHPHDTRRVVRALEVYQATGKPISYLQQQRKGLWDEYEVVIFCLDLAREELNQRINQRVEKMFQQGLIKEVKKLLKLKLSRTASYAIGIKEVKGYLEGEYDLTQAKDLMRHNTRLYAKRQLTWFRKDERIQWIKMDRLDNSKKGAEKLWKELY